MRAWGVPQTSKAWILNSKWKGWTFTISDVGMMNKDKASNEFIENLTRKNISLNMLAWWKGRKSGEATAKKLQIKRGGSFMHVLEMLCVSHGKSLFCLEELWNFFHSFFLYELKMRMGILVSDGVCYNRVAI